MADSRAAHEQDESPGWRPIESRHGWAKTGPDGTARAIVGETDAGYTAEVVDVGDDEDDADGDDDADGLPARWGPETFESPVDAIEAAEAHLTADDAEVG